MFNYLHNFLEHVITCSLCINSQKSKDSTRLPLNSNRWNASTGAVAILLMLSIPVVSFGNSMKLDGKEKTLNGFATASERTAVDKSVATPPRKQALVEAIQTPIADETNATVTEYTSTSTEKPTKIVPDYVFDIDIKPVPDGDVDLEDPGVIKAPVDVVVVKFVDDKYRIRLIKKNPKDPYEKGYLKDINGNGLLSETAKDALEALSDGQWARSFEASEKEIDELREIAIKRTGGKEHLADLNNYFALKLPKGMSREEARELLLKLEEVENVFYVPDLYTADADDYAEHQGTYNVGGQVLEYPYQKYLDPAPVGVDARYAWLYIGGDGEGVTFVDVEQYYDYDHADLPEITNIGAPFNTAELAPGRTDHGTATLGVVAGIDNFSGVKGIAHAADIRFAAKGGLSVDYALGWAFGLENTILQNITVGELKPGDVILIEQQLAGPNRPANPSPGNQFGMVAVEWYKPAYDVIRIATANGFVVVEAAGNGEQNLDNLEYLNDPFATHRPFLVVNGERVNDSGAIIVGAGAADSDWSQIANPGAPRERLDFSNYGARVDVQCWGDSVVTSGPGRNNSYTLYDDDGEHNTYRRDYGGTSSASAIIGGVATSLQGAYKNNMDKPLSSHDMRELLINTGTPQTGDTNEHIGPLPDLRAALETAIDFTPAPTFGLNEEVSALEYCDDGDSLDMPLVEFSVEPGMLAEGQDLEVQLLFGDVTVQGAEIFFTLDGTLPTPCNDPNIPSCNPTTQVWTQEDLTDGNAIIVPFDQLPVMIHAKQSTTACGAFQQPVSELASAHYVPYSEVPGPTIYLSDGDTDVSNDVVVLQASKIFTRSEVSSLPNSELCVRFHTTSYVRYTLDGSNPLDTTEGNWEDPYGVIPENATPIYDTQVNASPIWTAYNNSQGQCVPIFDVNDEADTLVTVKAQNFVYLGGGPYVGSTITVESYLLID